MIVRNIYIVILIFFIFFSCGKRKLNNKFSIYGKINGGYNGYVYLETGNSIDSTLVIDSTFIFKGKVINPTKAYLLPRNPNSETPMAVSNFMLENSSINIYLTFKQLKQSGLNILNLRLDSISGSTSQKLLEKFQLKMENTFYKEKNDSIRETILFENLSRFIEDNPKSIIGGEELAEKSNFYGYLSSSQMEFLLKKLDTSFQSKKDLRYIKSIIERRKILDIGKIPPKILLPNTKNKLINSHILEGNFLLLEFWASWCGSCRKTNPELRKIYNLYNRKDFEILGISQDKDIEKWKTAIREDSLKWIQVIDTLDITGEKYKLTTIPYNILLDKERKVIARNLKPNKLKKILKEKIK